MQINSPNCRTAEFLLYEEEFHMSRQNIKLAAGAALPAGQLLGKITATGLYGAYSDAASDGRQTVAGILYAAAPARTATTPAVAIVREAAVSRTKLTGLDAAGEADLAAMFIQVLDNLN